MAVHPCASTTASLVSSNQCRGNTTEKIKNNIEKIIYQIRVDFLISEAFRIAATVGTSEKRQVQDKQATLIKQKLKKGRE